MGAENRCSTHRITIRVFKICWRGWVPREPTGTSKRSHHNRLPFHPATPPRQATKNSDRSAPAPAGALFCARSPCASDTLRQRRSRAFLNTAASEDRGHSRLRGRRLPTVHSAAPALHLELRAVRNVGKFDPRYAVQRVKAGVRKQSLLKRPINGRAGSCDLHRGRSMLPLHHRSPFGIQRFLRR